jgi:sugar O-acyltransferase (sialic acid O-acetyltransferase NeuD family)
MGAPRRYGAAVADSPRTADADPGSVPGAPLVIVGAGGHGRETLDVVEAVNAVAPTWCFLGFVADVADAALLARRRVELLGPADDLDAILHDHDAGYHLAIGSSATRARLDDGLVERGLGHRARTLIRPLASTGSDLRLAPGVFLAAGARVTTNVTLGRHTHLNVNAVVSHDCEIGDHVTLSPGAMVNGSVTLGSRVFLGTGAVVLPGRTIGHDAIIAAGAVVTTDVPVGVTAVGVPAVW